MSIKKQQTASFFVDPQKSFAVMPNELPVPGGGEIVDELNFMATFADVRVASKDAHAPNAPWVVKEHKDMLKPTGMPNADLTWVSHCVPGTEGFEFLDGLPDPSWYSLIVYKGLERDYHPYGACAADILGKMSTGVIEFLKFNGIKRVIVGGLALDFCVKTTALQLAAADFEVVLYMPACRGISEEGCEKALAEMKAAGIQIINNKQELAELA